MTETPINVLKRARDLMATDMRRIANVIAGIDAAIDALQPQPNAHKANMYGDDVVLAKSKPDLHCDYCGRTESNMRATHSYMCAPPFERRPHEFTGQHPADKFMDEPPKAPQLSNLKLGSHVAIVDRSSLHYGHNGKVRSRTFCDGYVTYEIEVVTGKRRRTRFVATPNQIEPESDDDNEPSDDPVMPELRAKYESNASGDIGAKIEAAYKQFGTCTCGESKDCCPVHEPDCGKGLAI